MTLGNRYILAITCNIQKCSKSPSKHNSTDYLCHIPNVVAYSLLHRVTTANPRHCGAAVRWAQHHEYAATPILPFVEAIPHDESGTWCVGCAISECANIVVLGRLL